VRQELGTVVLYLNAHLESSYQTADFIIDSRFPPSWSQDPKYVRKLSTVVHDGKIEKDFVSAWLRPWHFVSTEVVRKAKSWEKIKDEDVVLMLVTDNAKIRYGVTKLGIAIKLTSVEYAKLCPAIHPPGRGRQK
jgi:hypothetical protein